MKIILLAQRTKRIIHKSDYSYVCGIYEVVSDDILLFLPKSCPPIGPGPSLIVQGRRPVLSRPPGLSKSLNRLLVYLDQNDE